MYGVHAQGIPDEKKRKLESAEAGGRILISCETKINEEDIQVEVELPEDGLRVWADEDAITQVIYNLTDNAVKFCPQQGVLWVKVVTQGTKARVVVGNTGATIPEEELPLLFDRFHKVDKSRSEDRAGYGLGQVIGKNLVCWKGQVSVSTRAVCRLER